MISWSDTGDREPAFREAVGGRRNRAAGLATGPQVPPLRFLVVDDTRDIRELLVRMVERLGHEAQTANDGVEAVELLAVERFDFMLLDLTMPRMSGEDVVRWLHEHPDRGDGLRVVIVSAWAGEHRAHLQELGVHAVLPKPLRPHQLRNIINEAITTTGS